MTLISRVFSTVHSNRIVVVFNGMFQGDLHLYLYLYKFKTPPSWQVIGKWNPSIFKGLISLFVMKFIFNTILVYNKEIMNIPSRVLGLSSDFLGSFHFGSDPFVSGVLGSTTAASAKFSLSTCITLLKSSWLSVIWNTKQKICTKITEIKH